MADDNNNDRRRDATDTSGPKPGRLNNAQFNRAVTQAELDIEAAHQANPKAADPVLSFRQSVPAAARSRITNRAEVLAHSEDVDRPQPGEKYNGRITGQSKDYLYQQVGNRTIQHERKALTGNGYSDDMRGKHVEVNYPVGRVGLVSNDRRNDRSNRGQDKELSRDVGDRGR